MSAAAATENVPTAPDKPSARIASICTSATPRNPIPVVRPESATGRATSRTRSASSARDRQPLVAASTWIVYALPSASRIGGRMIVENVSGV